MCPRVCDHETVQTYAPNFLEEHTDSSDFECHKELENIKKNKLFLNKELLRKVKMKERHQYTKKYINYDDYRKIIEYQQKNIQVPDRYTMIKRQSDKINKLKKSQDRDQSRSEIVLRDKVITRFSNIFRHANSIDKNEATKENLVKNDHACQVYSLNRKNTYTRFKKVRQSDFNPIHELKRQVETPYKTTKIVNYTTQKDLRNVSKKNSAYTVLPTYSSISSELDVVTLDSKEHQEHTIHNEFKINNLKRKSDQQTKLSYIYPKTRDYQVFPGLSNQSRDVGTSWYNGSSKTNILQARSSVFWEYMINKIQQRCHQQKVACSKPCHCGEVGCDAKKTQQVCCNKQDPYTGLCCNSSFNNAVPQPPHGMLDSLLCKTKNKKIQCQCPSDEAQNLRNQYELPLADETPEQDTRPCQQDHDLVTKTLAEKYNGEILCIHNPPCILINGCLNVGPKETATPLWYVSQDRNNNFSQNNKSGIKNNDKFHSKYIGMMQCYEEDDRKEREIQSICNHNPPCKFVRQCCKPKYSAKLDCCCIHVPMCRKVPECLLDCEDYDSVQKTCKHKPKCPELPLCAKDWLIYGEVSNVQSEVKRFSDLVCQHHPPCIKIPKCLGRMMCEGFIPYDAIPDCSHQPACDRIPACFRRTPKMVSTYSQYPAPCRIV